MVPMVTKPASQRRKIDDLAAYVTGLSANDRTFDALKLNWLLFLCDFTAYARLGASISGSPYVRGLHAPAPRSAPQSHGRVAASRFSPPQRRIIEEVVRRYTGRAAAVISRSDPEHGLGWRVAAEGEGIPRASALLSAALTPEDREWAQKVARGRGA